MTWRTEDLTLALRITASHRDYQQIIVSANRDGFSATRSSWLDTGDIEQFAEQVHHMWQDLAGASPSATTSMATTGETGCAGPGCGPPVAVAR